MPDKYPVKAIDSAGGTLEGEIEAWEESPSDPDQVVVRLHLAGVESEKTADDFFSALVAIRVELDAKGIRLMNYGSSLNVYPSPMSRSMGSGEKAYRLSMGEQAKTADLVSIFETGPDVTPSTVQEQEQFYRKWISSLGK
jgi:hypothetical protein